MTPKQGVTPRVPTSSLQVLGRLALLAFVVFAENAQAASNADSEQQSNREQRAEAKQHYQHAKKFVEQAAFEEAAEEFRKAYRALPHYEVLYNLGQTYVALGQPVAAFEALSQYLAEGGSRVKPARRAEVEREIARQKALIAELVIDATPNFASIEVDGHSIPTQDPAQGLHLSSGEHTISVSAPGYLFKMLRETLSPAEQRTLTVVLEPAPLAPNPAPSEPVQAELVISCPVSDVEVSVDGRPLAKTPLTTRLLLPAGSHQVGFERPGYQPSQRRAALVQAKPLPLTCEARPLSPLPRAFAARLMVTASEPGATIAVDGAPFSGAGDVPYGRHRLDVSHPGFLAWRGDVILSAGQTTLVEARLTATPEYALAHRASAQRRRWLAYGLAGTGVALGVTGLGLYLDNGSRFTAWQKEQQTLNTRWSNASSAAESAAVQGQQDDNDARGRSVLARDRSALVLGLAGGALVAVGAALFFSGDTPSHSSDITLGVHRQGASISWLGAW